MNAGPDDTPPEVDPEAKSFGNISEHHWSRARKDENAEAIEYYRERSRAPGVAAGGAERNHYCPSCKGVIPLRYDRREASGAKTEHCPHCGVELEARVREMFNWVEIDQVHGSDVRALLPFVLIGFLVVALTVAGAIYWLG